MAKRFTQVKLDAFKEIQLEAGVITTEFNPANPILDRSKILLTTTGGINPVCKPSYTDYFSDVDNVPNNTMQGKQVDDWDCSISTTALNITPEGVKTALGAADIDPNDTTRITPRRELKLEDFKNLWWVGDMSDGGFAAIHLLNALSTDGFSLKTTKKGKGNTAITLTGHTDMNAIDTVPMAFYVVPGEDEESDSIVLDKASASVPAGNTVTITATTVPDDATVAWQSLDEDVATVEDGVVTGVAAGTTTIIASFTDDYVTYTALCVVTVTSSGGEG